ELFKHDFTRVAAHNERGRATAVTRMRRVPVALLMHAEAEVGTQLAAGPRIQRDVAEGRHEQHDAAAAGRDPRLAGPALADRDRADWAGIRAQIQPPARGRADFARSGGRGDRADP